MKDQEARDQIERLTERIRVLERDSRVGLTACERYLNSEGNDGGFRYGTSLDVAVELILEYLGVTLEFVPYATARHILVKKETKEEGDK